MALRTGQQLLQRLLPAVAVDQQHLLDPVLLEAHIAEWFPEVQDLPCLALRELEHLHGLLHQALLVALPQQLVAGAKVSEKLAQALLSCFLQSHAGPMQGTPQGDCQPDEVWLLIDELMRWRIIWSQMSVVSMVKTHAVCKATQD